MTDYPKKVELIGVLRHPTNISWDTEDYSVSGAMGCFAEECSGDIQQKHKVNQIHYVKKTKTVTEELNWEQTKELMMKETSGRGHGAVIDQSCFVYSIDNLTRASTLLLCEPEYASHLQQPLRRATAERGFCYEEFNGTKGFVKTTSEGDEIMKEQFELYDKMREAGLPTEDSRIILPLNTKTTIQTEWDARELMHLEAIVSDPRQMFPSDVRDTIEKMYSLAEREAPILMKNRGFNMERLSFFPSSQLFYKSNSTIERVAGMNRGLKLLDFSCGIKMFPEEIKEAVENRNEALLSNLKHYHFSFIAPMSLMTFHQATRQRTWNQAVEPLKSAINRGRYVTPSCIEQSGFKDCFDNLMIKSINYVRKNLENPNAYGVIPHALEVYDMIHINGWNALHSVGKRTCKTAQWEIRDIAKKMAGEINRVAPEIGRYSLPQGMLYGTCPERNNCGYCKK